jgi:hypothetical protein
LASSRHKPPKIWLLQLPVMVTLALIGGSTDCRRHEGPKQGEGKGTGSRNKSATSTQQGGEWQHGPQRRAAALLALAAKTTEPAAEGACSTHQNGTIQAHHTAAASHRQCISSTSAASASAAEH